MFSSWFFLFLAILIEVIGTSFLKYYSMTKSFFTLIIVLVLYGSSFFFLSKSLNSIPTSIAYSLWAGFGTIGITIISSCLFNEKINLISFFGITLILFGSILIKISQQQ